MKIGIDARFWGTEHTGIGRYVMELIGALLDQENSDEYVFFMRRKYFEQLKFRGSRVKLVSADLPHYSVAEQLYFPRLIRQEKVELMHYPHFTVPVTSPVPYVVTIHDLIKHFSRGQDTTTRTRSVYWLKFAAYDFVLRRAVRRAGAIIVPSEWSKNQLMEKLSVSAAKIRIVPEAVAASLTRKKNFLAVKRSPKPYLLYVGNLYPHKNVSIIIEALQLMTSSPLGLKIVCARSVFTSRFLTEVRRRGAQDSVELLGQVSDNQLANLYKGATAYVFPSRLEGFGLPGLEAMALGTPVVAARASSLPEVYGKAAIYFDPDSSSQLADRLQELIADPGLGAKLRRLGYRQAKRYSWQKAAQQTRKVYGDVVRAKKE